MGENRPRFAFEITEEQQRRALKVFPEYGQRRAIMGRVLNDIMDMVDRHGPLILGLLMDDDTRPRNTVPSLVNANKNAKKIKE